MRLLCVDDDDSDIDILGFDRGRPVIPFGGNAGHDFIIDLLAVLRVNDIGECEICCYPLPCDLSEIFPISVPNRPNNVFKSLS